MKELTSAGSTESKRACAAGGRMIDFPRQLLPTGVRLQGFIVVFSSSIDVSQAPQVRAKRSAQGS